MMNSSQADERSQSGRDVHEKERHQFHKILAASAICVLAIGSTLSADSGPGCGDATGGDGAGVPDGGGGGGGRFILFIRQ
jgi:hypothetical protein